MAALDQILASSTEAALALILVTVLISGFIRGFLGFGGALIIIMVVNVVVGPQFAVPLACLAGLPPTIQLLPSAIRESDRSFALPFGLLSLLMVSILKPPPAASHQGNWSDAEAAAQGAQADPGSMPGNMPGTAGQFLPPMTSMNPMTPGATPQKKGKKKGKN